MLLRAGVRLEPKPFSIGARIEHSQRQIDRAQYGAFAGHPALGAAEYRLSARLGDGRGVYTFCMCPGGSVIAAASEAGGTVVNGMSEHARAGENANSAVLVDVRVEDFPGADPLAGVRFARLWEQRAYALGGYRAPAQLVGDFLRGQASSGPGGVQPTYRPGVAWGRLDECLPDFALRGCARAFGSSTGACAALPRTTRCSRAWKPALRRPCASRATSAARPAWRACSPVERARATRAASPRRRWTASAARSP